MPITRLTAIEIQTNEVKITAKGPFPNGKFGMSILMMRGDYVHKEMLSVDKGHYETEEAALKFGNDLVEEIMGMDLSK